MKNIKLWLVSCLILVVLLVPFALKAQTREIPPLPPFPQPPVILSNEEGKAFLSNATPTPDAEQVKKLPYEKPSVIPTVQFIDLAPEMAFELKYEIHILSGKTGETLIVLVPRDVENEKEVINKYVHEDKGDTYRIIIPSGIFNPKR